MTVASASSQTAGQVATPSTNRPPWHDHPVVGVWRWVSNPVHSSSAIVADDGTYLEYDPLLGVGIGLWRATAERTAEVVVTFQHVTREWEVFASRAVPEAPAFRSDLVVGLAAMRITIKVGADGNALTATGMITGLDAQGDIIHTLNQYSGKAVRLQADTTT